MRGSVMKRGKTWSYVLYLGRDDRTGAKRQKWVGGFATKKLAEEALTEALERVRTGNWADPGPMTVGEFCEQWLRGMKPTIRAKTHESYTSMLTHHVVENIGKVKLANLKPHQISGLYADLMESGSRRGKKPKGLSPKTVNYVHRIFRHAMSDAVRWGLLTKNPVDLVDPPRAPRKEMRAWTPEEARRFIDHAQDDRLCGLWVLLISTGMRRGEACGLKWADVDLDKGTAAIRRSLSTVGYEVVEEEPKTVKSRRLVALDRTTVEVLRAHRKRQLEERMLIGPGWDKRDFVFTRADGTPLHPDDVSKVFAKTLKQLDLPRIRLHDLRHTSATMALAAGVHPKIVSERLGHATVSMTLDIYSHVVHSMQEEAAERIGDVLFGGGEATG
jgi:integrase